MAHAQSKFKFGPTYNLGISSFYGNKMGAMEMNGAEMQVFSSKTSSGVGAKFQYSINNHLALNLNTAYQQRGAIFDKGMYDYNPRYQLHYLDLILGASFQTKELIKKSKLCFSIAGTYNTLLKSLRTNSYESYNIMSDSKMSDIGTLLSIGLNIPRLENDILQASLFTNLGFNNVFSGEIAKNGIMGKNIVYGIQVAYLFGFQKEKK